MLISHSKLGTRKYLMLVLHAPIFMLLTYSKLVTMDRLMYILHTFFCTSNLSTHWYYVSHNFSVALIVLHLVPLYLSFDVRYCIVWNFVSLHYQLVPHLTSSHIHDFMFQGGVAILLLGVQQVYHALCTVERRILAQGYLIAWNRRLNIVVLKCEPGFVASIILLWLVHYITHTN